MRLLILGGDGFCGWPTALHLSAGGHEVLIVDNLVRRAIDRSLGCDSLTPIRPIRERIAAWRELTGRHILYRDLDLARDYAALAALLAEYRPAAIVHFAQQRAAPYSMKTPTTKRYTVDNNVNATSNLLTALVDTGLDSHVVHLGTMGVYGYGTAGAKIPEGYLKVQVPHGAELVEREILYPTSPGSVYHLTKSIDQLMFAFFAQNDGLRVTDLHQGIVWGTQTAETQLDERLINRFDYDGDYGTVLNRFVMQAAIGHPLTVHGSGGQTRAFIHIRDTVRCIEIALRHPPQAGDRVKIYNQMTETHKVRDLARLVSEMTGVPVDHVANPRHEADENELQVENRQLLSHGLDPVTLDRGLLDEIHDIAERYAARCDRARIPCCSYWNWDRQYPDPDGIAVAQRIGRTG